MNRQAQANAEAGAQLRRTAHSYGLLEAMFDRAARRRHHDDLKSAARLFDALVAEHSLPKGSGEAWRDGAVIRLPAHGRVIVVGDLHGDIESLHSILKASHFLERASESKDTHLLCLGDYVDRGPEPFAVLDVLVRLKTSFHSQVFLLCGNHETERLNRNFGFLEQCAQRNAADLYEAYNLAFVRLPLAATAPNGLVALHGAPHRK